jgi:hypothetical protein
MRANQLKNLTRGGAQVFQVSFHELDMVEPWNNAR